MSEKRRWFAKQPTAWKDIEHMTEGYGKWTKVSWEPFFAKLCKPGENPELSSKQATIRNWMSKYGGERDWRWQISVMLFIINHRIGHLNLRDIEEEEEQEKWCGKAANWGRPCWNPCATCPLFFSQRETGKFDPDKGQMHRLAWPKPCRDHRAGCVKVQPNISPLSADLLL